MLRTFYTILTILALLLLAADAARAEPPTTVDPHPSSFIPHPSAMAVRKLAPAGPWEIVEGDRPVLRYNYQTVAVPDAVKPRIAPAIRNMPCRGPITSIRSTACTARS